MFIRISADNAIRKAASRRNRFEKHIGGPAAGPGTPTILSIAIDIVALQTIYNAPTSLQEMVLRLCNRIVPSDGNRIPHLRLIYEYFLDAALAGVGKFQVDRVDLCPKGCVAFRNLLRAEDAALHSIEQATVCPKCKSKRFFDDAGKNPQAVCIRPAIERGLALLKPVNLQFFFLFPFAPQLRALLARTDTAPHMSWANQPTTLPGGLERGVRMRCRLTDRPRSATLHRPPRRDAQPAIPREVSCDRLH
jgi:hypothetical protein